MFEALGHFFAHLCGQNPAHTWAPGGLALPCCQRCTGLYAGAAVAATLLFWLRPRLNRRFLGAHGLGLLFMAPLGFHWVPDGPVLRAVSGVLFAFGVAAFLWLPVAEGMGWADRPRSRATPTYALALVLTLALVPALACWGGTGAAYTLAALIAAGAACFLALVLGALGALLLT